MSRWNARFTPSSSYTLRKSRMGHRDKNPSHFPNLRCNTSSAREGGWKYTFTVPLNLKTKFPSYTIWVKFLMCFLVAYLITYRICLPVISIVSWNGTSMKKKQGKSALK